MALDTVQDYVDRCRVLLLDTVAPYRYADADLVENLNMGILEARRLRPDLMKSYFRSTLPDYTTTNMSSTNVDIDAQYRVAFVYYMCGHAQLRDDENNQDSRAVTFLNKFTAQLLSVAA